MMVTPPARSIRQEQDSAFLHINDTPVYFQEDWNTGIGGGLWSTGLAFARYLEHHSQHALSSLDALHDHEKKLSLLELGSGNGFLAICMLALYKDIWNEFVVTDVESHLDLIETTLHANPHLVGDTNVTVMQHLWGEFHPSTDSSSCSIQNEVNNGTFKFDVIIGSDVAYRQELYDPLISSLKQFSHAKTVCLIGVTMNDTRPQFFHKLREAGFRYERLADWLLEPEYRGNTFGIFVIQQKVSTWQ